MTKLSPALRLGRMELFVFAALLFSIGCGASAASGSRGLDANTEDEISTGDIGDDDSEASADAPPTGCVVTWLAPGTPTSCRASWLCDEGNVFTYACGSTDAGARCFCIDGSGVGTCRSPSCSLAWRSWPLHRLDPKSPRKWRSASQPSCSPSTNRARCARRTFRPIGSPDSFQKKTPSAKGASKSSRKTPNVTQTGIQTGETKLTSISGFGPSGRLRSGERKPDSHGICDSLDMTRQHMGLLSYR